MVCHHAEPRPYSSARSITEGAVSCARTFAGVCGHALWQQRRPTKPPWAAMCASCRHRHDTLCAPAQHLRVPLHSPGPGHYHRSTLEQHICCADVHIQVVIRSFLGGRHKGHRGQVLYRGAAGRTRLDGERDAKEAGHAAHDLLNAIGLEQQRGACASAVMAHL